MPDFPLELLAERALTFPSNPADPNMRQGFSDYVPRIKDYDHCNTIVIMRISNLPLLRIHSDIFYRLHIYCPSRSLVSRAFLIIATNILYFPFPHTHSLPPQPPRTVPAPRFPTCCASGSYGYLRIYSSPTNDRRFGAVQDRSTEPDGCLAPNVSASVTVPLTTLMRVWWIVPREGSPLRKFEGEIIMEEWEVCWRLRWL